VKSDKKNSMAATRLIQAGRRKAWTGPIVNPPIHRASTILYDDIAALKAGVLTNEDGKFFYGRRGTPTQWALAEALTEMEPGAAGTMLFPSGVAAIASALMSILKPGGHLLMVDSAYDPTRSFCDGFLKDWGVETTYYDPAIAGGIDALIRPNTSAILMESPGSHSFEVQDVPAIVAVAKARGITTLIDNTWATPFFLTTIDKGIDLTICVATKYLSGHSDVMLGAVTANEAHWPKLRQTAQTLGQYVGPDDAWLVLRGLRTLSLRMRQHEASALAIAHWLKDQPDVARVLHPALADCPGHDLWRRDFTGSAGLFSVILKGGNDQARAAMIDGLSHFGIGYSWGGFESLAVPSDPAKWRTAVPWEAEGPGIRLSIGLEDPEDLIIDLAAGLQRFRAACAKR
jgi:cysteine-S-conjugate beta-lyase